MKIQTRKRAPSVTALLRTWPALTRADAVRIRKMLLSEGGLQAVQDAYGAVLGTHGVEYIPAGRNSKSPSMLYLNTGETYGTTIIYSRRTYSIGAWGDRVERGNYD